MNLKFSQIQPLVSMVTDRMGKTVSPLSFLGCFSSILFIRHVIMTCMRARKSSNFGLIGPSTAELAALERLKNPHRLIMGKTMSPIFSAVLDRTLFMLGGTDNIHESLDEFEIQSNLIRDHRVSCS